METKSLEALQEVYNDFLNERKKLQDKIDENLSRVAEIDSYLKSIYEKEDSDFKVFSPRNVESVYKEQIAKAKQQKTDFENENQYLYKQVNKLSRYIEKISIALEEKSSKIDSNELNILALDIKEKDRQRIARDLHDTSLQNLAHLIHMIELSSMYIDKDPIRAKLELATVNKNLRSIIEDIRNTIFDLRPMSFDDLGFQEMVIDFINKMRENHKIEIIDDIDKIEVTNQIVFITLYRVIKECILNSLEHSKCDKIIIRVKEEVEENNIRVYIEDNGIGFDKEEIMSKIQNHYGLKIVEERIELIGGNINISSKINEGTKVLIKIPLI